MGNLTSLVSIESVAGLLGARSNSINWLFLLLLMIQVGYGFNNRNIRFHRILQTKENLAVIPNWNKSQIELRIIMKIY